MFVCMHTQTHRDIPLTERFYVEPWQDSRVTCAHRPRWGDALPRAAVLELVCALECPIPSEAANENQ